ncbi:MAG: hypothetical protein NT165_02995 [Candidatus Falkowbacteria bacterium]|nr:hypothetical protein [Candidatus Falkowbacteria bacterium]
MKKILLVSLLGLALTGCGVKSSPPASVEEKPIDQAAINDAYCHSGRVLTKNQLDGLTKTENSN